jgi:excinuclease ABC subunit A
MEDVIRIKGAREHNLKNIDLELPRNKLIVFTGLSGSGKSSLAFDTIYAEGQRRYIESLSAYARQFLGQMQKPDVDYIEGLSPAVSIDQKARSHNPRSTVGTVTEIYDYLRVLFARVGIAYCPNDGTPIEKLSVDQIIENIIQGTVTSDQRTKNPPAGGNITILAPVVRGRKGEYHQLLNDLYTQGYLKARVDGKFKNLKERIVLSRYKQHTIEAVVDEIELTNFDQQLISRLSEAIEQAIQLSDEGLVLIKVGKEEQTFSTQFACPQCGFAYEEITPRLFSFNSPYGACPECGGLGVKKEIDADLVIPDKNKSIEQGAILPLSPNSRYYSALLRAVTDKYNIPRDIPIKDLSKEDLQIIYYGTGEPIRVRFFHRGGMNTFWTKYEGIISNLERRYTQTESEAVREEIEQYMANIPCPKCHGNRLKNEALSVKIGSPLRQLADGGKNIAQISGMSIKEALDFFQKLTLNQRQFLIAERLLKEIKSRLKFLNNVGLNYLTLDRAANTLAGGEAQRIRLASQVGSGLVGVLYVLDEPTIGLHMRDNDRLLNTLKHLRDLGNTVLVVEHDEDTIWSADHLVDIGPGAGKNGGKIVAEGNLDEILKNKDSLTAAYLRGDEKIAIPARRRPIDKKKFITIWQASQHNLKNITVHIPLGIFVCVTGVSGSGKSTLVHEVLYKTLAKKMYKAIEKPGKHGGIEGLQHINKVIIIDQSPIGRTPRSNPATYTGVFTPIRELFAATSDAQERGYSPGRFSFNVSGGRCETCQGDGQIKIEMHFLPDVYVPCEVCKGKRFNHETLEVKYKGKNIADILEMTVDEALDFFQNITPIADKLKVLQEVGLGYIHLGQPAPTLSGGEAQRVKLSTELSGRATGNSLYILDEPTTGLHFADVEKLLDVLNRLVTSGNTVLIIEHNPHVIKTADWIIDLGPEGGDEGGQIVAEGTPEEICNNPDSYTGKFLQKYLQK